MKKIIPALIALVLIFCATLTAFANEIQTYNKTYSSANTVLTVNSSGKATVTNEYYGLSNITKKVEMETKIQKKVAFIWVTVKDGKWTDTSTASSLSKSHSVQLTDSGTYRAKTDFVFTGADGTVEKATKTIEKSYGG